jgi:hypothetical protein
VKENTQDTRSRNRFSKIRPTKPTGNREEWRGFITYVSDDFYIVISERDKLEHKMPRKAEDPLPQGETVLDDGTTVHINSAVITGSALFSACREYMYDKKRKAEFYQNRKKKNESD